MLRADNAWFESQFEDRNIVYNFIEILIGK